MAIERLSGHRFDSPSSSRGSFRFSFVFSVSVFLPLVFLLIRLSLHLQILRDDRPAIPFSAPPFHRPGAHLDLHTA